MLQLNVSRQPAKLEVMTYNAQLLMQSTQAELQIQTTPARLEIHQPNGELTIDSTPSRYSMGLKNIEDFSRDNAQLGKQAVLEAISQTNADGDRLLHIERKGNTFASMAAEASVPKSVDINLGQKEPPIIHYRANPVQINSIEGKLQISAQPGTISGQYQPGSVAVHVTQYPSIQMSVVDVKV